MPKLTRRQVLGSAAAAAAVGCGRGSRPPNIVYIYADQHRAPLVGAYGAEYVLTPHLDALAAEAVHFTECFTNSTLCRPARATMMTGLLPVAHGSLSNNYISPRREDSHVRKLQRAGYRTAMYGKAHLDETVGDTRDPRLVARLEDWGFTDVMELLSQPHTAEFGNPYSAWLRDSTPTGETPKDARYRDYVDNWSYVSNNPPPDAPPYGLTTDDHLDVFCGRRAVDYLHDRVGDDQPFYLQVNFPGPHSPFDSPQEFRDLYRASDLPLPILGAPSNAGGLVDYLHENKPELHSRSATDYQQVLLTYLAKITLIDAMVGEVLAALRDTGRLGDTWIVYHSDHGELVGDHELWGKVAMYEGSLRVPLIVRPPGGTAPWASRAMVDQRDVTETLLDIGGQTGIGGGASLLGTILGGDRAARAHTHREHVVAMVEGSFSRGQGYRTAMVRDGRHKLIRDLELDENQVLYDLDADPEEQLNQLGAAGTTTIERDLRDRLEAELSEARQT